MDERPSVWSVGLGLGCFTTAALLLSALLRQLPFQWAWLPIGISIVVMCWAGLPVVVWGTSTGWSVWTGFYAWRHRNDRPASSPPPAPPSPAVVIRRIGGQVNGHERAPIDMVESRPARWVAWQAAAVVWLEWHTRRRSLTRDALTGPGLAFGAPADWVSFTDELARAGLANKTNGRATTLALPLPVVRDRIERGMVEWRTDLDPPSIAPPRPAGGVVVEGVAA